MGDAIIEAVAKVLSRCADSVLTNQASSRPDLRFSRWFLNGDARPSQTYTSSSYTASRNSQTFQGEGLSRSELSKRGRRPRVRARGRGVNRNRHKSGQCARTVGGSCNHRRKTS